MKLTRARTAWVNQFKPDMLRGGALNPNAMVERRYADKLTAAIARMTRITEKELHKLFRSEVATEYFGQDESIASQARILTNALIDKFDAYFDSISAPYSEAMINNVDAASSSTLHTSLQQLSGGLSLPTTAFTSDLKEIIKAATVENVALIKSIPRQYLGGVQQAVMRSITTGNGLADLVPYLQKHKGITERRALNIANDQTSKTYSAMNAERMQNVGITEYEWLHTPGSRYPRHLHEELNGKICSFANPPVIQKAKGGQPEVRGHPGQLINCNCRMRSVIRFKGEHDEEGKDRSH